MNGKPRAAAPPSSQPTQPAPRDRSAPRNTATFQPYYWEAYNEVVEPRRFDHYLIRKWLKVLGPLGFALVKALRDRCYHDPRTGTLRDRCEVDLDELAEEVGVSRRTLTRELADNAALAQFVRRVAQYQVVGARVHRQPNLWQISMDDPVHPDDMERYDLLRARKEQDRDEPLPDKIINRPAAPGPPDPADQAAAPLKTHEGHFDPHRKTGPAHAGQNDLHNTGQDDPIDEGQNDPAYRSGLPSGGLLTKESLTPTAWSPPINAPQGADAPDAGAAPLLPAWEAALRSLSSSVNEATYKAHIKRLRPVSLSEEDGAFTVVLSVPSAFTREWVEKRHGEEIASALADGLCISRDALRLRFELIAK